MPLVLHIPRHAILILILLITITYDIVTSKLYNNNKRPLTPKSMPPAGDEHAKTQNLGPQHQTQGAKEN